LSPGLLVAAGLAALQLPGALPRGLPHPAGESPPADRTVPLAVPFLPQGELLCGGAAAAMVERYWGARGVYAEDYLSLVRPQEGGIRTADLEDALRDRGYRVRTTSGHEAAERLEHDGIAVPLVLLLRSGRTRFHYVVLVALDERRALVHDPMLGPRRPLSREELRRRWSASGFWALEARPIPDPRPAGHDRSADAPSAARPAHPLASEAVAALRSARHDDARRHAARLVAESPADSALARRLMATASYLGGEPELALSHWNRLGEPRLDLIAIDGLDVTRHPLVWRHLGLRPRAVLTPASLRRARRRLDDVPALAHGRIDYHPVGDGSAEARAVVMELPRSPGAGSLVRAGVDALVDEEVGLTLGPLLGSGDAWRLMARWHPADAAAGGRVAALLPPLPGVVHVSSGWRRQRFRADDGGTYEEARVSVATGVAHWWTAAWRLGGEVGMERRSDGSRLGVAEVSALRGLGGGAAWAGTRVGTWVGADGAHGRMTVEARAELPHGIGRSWLLSFDAAWTTRDAPRSLWNGAGTGHLGEPLLRGHSLTTDGVIAGPAFGRGLVVASVQHVSWLAFGVVRVGVGAFVDAASSWHRAGGSEAGAFVDPGLEAIVESERWRAALSLAGGGGVPVLSARVGALERVGW